MVESKSIDGKQIASRHELALIERLTDLKRQSPIIPQAVSFYCDEAGDPNWTRRYTLMKEKKARELGINFRPQPYTPQTSFSELAKMVNECNRNPWTHGIMFQLPLFEKLEKFRDPLLRTIDPKKDVDGLTREGRKIFVPPTVKAVISIANEISQNWANQGIIVEGTDSEDGQIIIETLNKRRINFLTSESDFSKSNIVILTSGQYENLNADMIQEGVIIIDTTFKKLDDSIYQKCRAYTPPLGGLGPIIITCLMENIIDSYEKYVLI